MNKISIEYHSSVAVLRQVLKPGLACHYARIIVLDISDLKSTRSALT